MQIRTTRDLGATIRQARAERAWSQGDLAREVGVHQPKISAVERGAPGVRIGLVLQILHALGMSIDITVSPAPPKGRGGRAKKPADDIDLDKLADTGLE